jgi:uncharacterized protein (TIGR03435 family)
MTLPIFWNLAWTAALANHLWQSTAVTGIAWLLVFSLRNNHARTRYWVWMIASVKFLIPFSILITAGESLRSAFTTPIQRPALAVMMEQITLPFPQGASPAAVAYGGEAPAAASQPSNLVPLLLAVWLCGILLVLFSWVRGWLRIRASVRASSLMTLVAEVPVLSSPLLIEPGIFGIFRPVLLLPEGINERLTKAQLGAIIAHEMCHVRRRDNLTAAIHMVVEALFWFHPAVWWIKTRLLDEREQACDEVVLQSGNEADVYAESILNVCKFCIESPLACVAGVAGSDLKRRIARIMTERVALNLGLDRKLLLALAATVAIAFPVVFGLLQIKQANAQSTVGNPAQDITGTWQGTLHAGLDLRGVLKISKADGSGYNAVFYSIDQTQMPIRVTKIVLEGTTVRFSIEAGMSGSFEGKLSPDGTSIAGTWSQFSFTHPLTLTRAKLETAWEISTQQQPMAADANPSFATATIKPSKPETPEKALVLHGGHLAVTNITLSELITEAYKVNSKQIIGTRAWADTDKFDISAQYGGGEPNENQFRSMIQKLLADSFKLSLHRDKRELQVYALSRAGNGSKLAQSSADPKQLPSLIFADPGKLNVRNGTMQDFVNVMQLGVLDRPVLDQTGIQGRYDFTLNWTPDDSQFPGMGVRIPHPADGVYAPPPLPIAIQQQIGLKLEVVRAPVEALVIDHVEKPSVDN